MSEVTVSASLGNTKNGRLFGQVIYKDDINGKQECNLGQFFVLESVGVPYEFRWRFMGNELQFALSQRLPSEEESAVMVRMLSKLAGEKGKSPAIRPDLPCFLKLSETQAAA